LAANSVNKLLAILSACGILISTFAYAESIAGKPISDMLPWVIGLGAGAVVLHVPIWIIENASIRNRTFFWDEFSRPMPGWVVPLIVFLWLISIAHFVWLFFQGGGGVPVAQDGQYILSSRGRIVRVLTEPEYLMFKSWELRIFAALMISCYAMPMMYWWFPRSRAEIK
jgi:hypothetical protein